MSATVLVVDDLPQNIKLLEAKLSKEYYDILSAKSGMEALEILKSQSVDIILLDVMMPGMDGFETCKRVKADSATAHIPIVMVTALNEVENRIQGLEAGADDFITKPINDLALFARIRSLVRLKIMLDELRLRDQTSLKLGLVHENIELEEIFNTNIVVIDDDAVQSEQIINKLLPIHAKAIVISNPQNAIEEIILHNPDLVIVNTQLSDMDGLRLCSQIRSQERTRHVPLLIMVEEHDTELLVKGLDMGINDYLITPIEGNELLARVRTQLRRKKYQDALKNNYQNSINMALTDSLTGIYNRRYFEVHFKTLIDQAISTNKPLTLLMFDIDHFKHINDTYGHIPGDEVLKQLAKLVMQNIRITDLFARYGGEEFLIVLPDSDEQHTKQISERLRQNIENHNFIISADPGKIKCTISGGITRLLKDDNQETIIKRADKALYTAKENGRNRLIFSDDN